MPRITRTGQRNAVSEGMALGLVLCGVTSVSFEKWRADMSFEGAWRGWAYRGRFPQVNTDVSKGLDGVWVMTRASEGKHVSALFWDTSGGELTIYARQPDWDPNDDEDVAFALRVIDGNVPVEGWTALARDFLDRMAR